MGVFHVCRGQLASSDLDIARDGHLHLRSYARRAARYQRHLPRDQRAAAVLGAEAGHTLHLAQPDGGGAVRAPSHQRGDSGVDLRAQEPAEHAVLPAGLGRVPLVGGRSRTQRPLSCGVRAVCHGPDGQAANHYPAVRAAAVGLLAATPHEDWERNFGSRRRRVRTARLLGAGAGEDTAVRHCGRQRRDHHGGAARAARCCRWPSIRCTFASRMPSFPTRAT